MSNLYLCIFDIFLTGIKLEQTVRVAVEDSGVKPDSRLFSLYPKMCNLLLNSKSENTVKSYYYSFKRWERFITDHGHSALPAEPVHVALYLTSLISDGASSHPITNAFYSIKWAHSVNGLHDPNEN